MTIAFRFDLDERIISRIFSGVKATGWTGKRVNIGDVFFLIKASPAEHQYIWENDDARGAFDFRASGCWYLEVTIRSRFLAIHSVVDSIEIARKIARAFGDPIGERIRRIDLCADFANWFIGDVLSIAWVAQRKARVSEFEIQTHTVGGKITGFTICPGNPLMMRAYDKVAELNIAGREQKREIEYSLWKREGYQSEPVTRIEFQIRSDVLKQFKARDPDKIVEKLDGLWEYCTQKWVRLAIPNEEQKRRTRWEVDPRWLEVRSVIFLSDSAPLERIYTTSGATVEQTFGFIRNFLASRRKISPLSPYCGDPDEVCKTYRDFRQLPDNEARGYVYNLVDGYVNRMRTALADELITKHGPQEAAYSLWKQHDAACAKFSTTDGLDQSSDSDSKEDNGDEE